MLSALACAAAVRHCAADASQTPLQLEVVINGLPSHRIGSFVLFDGKRIGAKRAELKDVGLDPGASGAPDDMLMLDDIPKLRYVYDEPAQILRIQMDDGLRNAQNFSVGRSGDSPHVTPQSTWGALLNYDIYGAKSFEQDFRESSAPMGSLYLDARAFSPYGTIEQSAILSFGQPDVEPALRLNSTFQYSDIDDMVTYRAGDVINGGLEDTRPIRIGGLQAQSNFALRPDLVTMPLPSMSGVAAVPSTLDLFINSVKTFSQQVQPGPYTLSNIPVVSGAGAAQLVVTDSTGKQTTTSMPFYASASLLRQGLNSWSVEAGLPRLSFGSESDDYAKTPVASATFGRGILDWMTVESHVEVGAGIVNGGFGSAFTTGNFGIASGYVAGSAGAGNTGAQASASYGTQLFGFNIQASALQTFGSYGDLASATAKYQPIPMGVLLEPVFADYRPPRSLDRLSIGAPLSFDSRSSVSASFTRALAANGDLSEIVSASYSRTLPWDASVFATVFHDFGTTKSTGVLFGFSMPLGETTSISSGYSGGSGGGSVTTMASKTLDHEDGSYGYSVQDSEGANPYHAASAAYRSRYGVIQAAADQGGSSTGGNVDVRGSVATVGGDVFFSNWIDDGFGVVSTGSPGIPVFSENRPIGVTDSKGMFLVPTLRSYQANNVSIDPSNLPVDAEIASATMVAAPKDQGGALVDFKVHRETQSALVAFSLTGGSAIPPGSVGHTGSGEEFVIGYDGQAFIKSLGATNQATIELVGSTCRAAFDFEPHPGEQVRIGAVMCKPDSDVKATASLPSMATDPLQSVLDAGAEAGGQNHCTAPADICAASRHATATRRRKPSDASKHPEPVGSSSSQTHAAAKTWDRADSEKASM